MTFALSAAYAYPELISSPTAKRRGNQIIELLITGASADVDLDIGDLSGTFWTAVGSSAPGAAVLAALTSLYPQFSSAGCIAIESIQLLDRVQVASLTTSGQFSVAINSTTKLPEIAVNAADGETSWQIRLVCWLNDSQLGQCWAYPPST